MNIDARTAEEAERAIVEGDDGWRLYLLLALFDTRNESPLADLVHLAREGYERCNDERDAWNNFDSLWRSYTPAERSTLARSWP